MFHWQEYIIASCSMENQERSMISKKKRNKKSPSCWFSSHSLAIESLFVLGATGMADSYIFDPTLQGTT